MSNTFSTKISRQKKIEKKSTIFHLSDLDWVDIKVVCEIVMACKLAQETLEGEIYITGPASSLSSRRSVLISS